MFLRLVLIVGSGLQNHFFESWIQASEFEVQRLGSGSSVYCSGRKKRGLGYRL
jgi:hypothetical protein